MAPILLIESTAHSGHHPPVEYEHERQIPYREIPDRVQQIQAHLTHLGLGDVVQPASDFISPALTAVHSPDYLAALPTLSAAAAEAGHYLYPFFFPVRPEFNRRAATPLSLLGHYSFDIGSPVGAGTWQAALSAAQAAQYAAEALLRDKNCLPYALCRPPGHHAGRDFMGGYCYLNNAAICAAELKKHGRVAIIDIDYHHGNGTQQIFWEDRQVFFLSLHGHPDFEYPHYSGFEDETGAPNAAGTNLNLPLPRGTTGAEYRAALATGLSKLTDFRPDFLVISLGYDTYRLDPWSTFTLEVGDYAQIARLLASLKIPTALIQEGGYATADLPLLAESFLTGWKI